MWSEELKKMTIEHFGDFGGTILKTVVKGKYSYAVGFAESLIPECEKDKRYLIFSMDDSRNTVSFIKAYDFIEDLVEDGWAID